MFAYFKDNFLYLNIPRNGSNTYNSFLSRHGWEKINLFENSLNLSNMKIWGHLTEPNNRHTKGLAMYLRINPSINTDDSTIAKILVSGVFDEHTCSINMMMGPLMNLPIHWIPLDLTFKNHLVEPPQELNGDDLTNIFFEENGLDLRISKEDTKNQLDPVEAIIREKIKIYKTKFESNYNQIVKNFLEPDILLYNRVVEQYRKKYQRQ